MTQPTPPAAPIAVVERETGISKDTLRVWERRYGFPRPLRNEAGERLYPAEQLVRLRLIRRLLDAGFRPNQVVGKDEHFLHQLAAGEADNLSPAVPEPLAAVLRALKDHDAGAVRQLLAQQLMRQGLQHFAMETVPALNNLVGDAWSRGELEVFEEHLYTEQVQALLRNAIASLPENGGGPRLLLTTVPDEQHVLGLLMLEALLTLDGARCISLGTQTPLTDIVAAAGAHHVDVVALSFSGAFPGRQAPSLLAALRRDLRPGVELWAGGNGLLRTTAGSGIKLARDLPAALRLLAGWRTARGG